MQASRGARILPATQTGNTVAPSLLSPEPTTRVGGGMTPGARKRKPVSSKFGDFMEKSGLGKSLATSAMAKKPLGQTVGSVVTGTDY